jgi:hypothetical protein
MNIAFFAGFLNIGIGLLLTVACVMFAGGTMHYLFYMGSTHRDHGLELMHRAIVTLVVVVVLIGFARFLQAFFL